MNDSPNSIRITGRNALIALAIAVAITWVVAAVYAIIGAVIHLTNDDEVSLSWALHDAIGIFKVIGFCGAPILFILAFALLQRFRPR